MLYVAIWYVLVRPVVMRAKEELQFFTTKEYSIKK